MNYFSNSLINLFRLAKEKQLQSKLEEEIASLKAEVESANEGLAAAGRLSEQLDNKAQVISTLKQELKARDEHLKKAQGSFSNSLDSRYACCCLTLEQFLRVNVLKPLSKS